MRFEPVRKARIARGLPAAAVAQTADRSLGWVYAVERGLITPGRKEADAVATLLDTEADALFSRVREDEGKQHA